MVDDAAYGLMLWDGESKGTLNRVINVIRQEKPVVVYLAQKRMFREGTTNGRPDRRRSHSSLLRATLGVALRRGAGIVGLVPLTPGMGSNDSRRRSRCSRRAQVYN